MAMGSDEIAEKAIRKLDIALEELDETSKVAEETESDLLEHMKRIIEILRTMEEGGI